MTLIRTQTKNYQLSKHALYGSVNIFYFLLSALNCEITEKCLSYAIIGRNTDIINECLKKYSVDDRCIFNAIVSQNNQFLEYISRLNPSIFDNLDFNGTDAEQFVKSHNLKAIFLLFEKNNKLIFPWYAAFPQANKIIFNHWIDINICDSKDGNLLHYASMYNNSELCYYVLRHPCFNRELINSKEDNEDKTPIHYAIENNSIEVVKLLLTYNADIELIDKNFKKPIHYSAENNCKEITEFLLTYGAKPNVKDENMQTPLYYALMHNCIEIVELLVNNGANINDNDALGQTPLHYAARLNRKEVIEVLK